MRKIQPSSEEIKYCLVSSFNQTFAPVYIPLLVSIKNNVPKNLNLDIVLLIDDVSFFFRRQIEDVVEGRFNVRFVEGRDFIDKENYSSFLGKWALASIYRLWIPLKFKGYEKVLYLDSDTFIKNDFTKVFDESGSEGHTIAAVRDFGVRNPVLFRKMCSHIEGLLGEGRKLEYVNSGVVVFNFPFSEALYKKDLARAIQMCSSGMFPDQDVLNILFDGRKKFLDDKYNVQFGYYEQDRISFRKKGKGDVGEIVVAHFTGKSKPWSTLLVHEIYSYYWQVVLGTRVAPYMYSLNSSVRIRQAKNLERKRWRWRLKLFLYQRCPFLFFLLFSEKKKLECETLEGDYLYLDRWEMKMF